jgi:hypothetical protein
MSRAPSDVIAETNGRIGSLWSLVPGTRQFFEHLDDERVDVLDHEPVCAGMDAHRPDLLKGTPELVLVNERNECVKRGKPRSASFSSIPQELEVVNQASLFEIE